MISTIFLSGFASWDNPVTYLAILVILVLFLSARFLISANRILKQEGIEMTNVILKYNFGGILKWSSAHPKRVSVILLIIVLIGIILALTSGV